MPPILRVAILGAGKMAQQHAAAIALCPDASLVAIADPFVASHELVARFGTKVRFYADVTEMLAEVRPDIVNIVTPPDTHAALARQCLEAGANVYVEKPFASSTSEALQLIQLADDKGLRVCAAHQLLFQRTGRDYRQYLESIGDIAHIESFFSFRPVRRVAGESAVSLLSEQLIDILPHPVYLLLDALVASGGNGAEITGLDASTHGEVRALIRGGRILSCLTVSLSARPVESWLRIMGSNGMIEADFVIGNVITHLGPGASAPAVILKPFSRAWQIWWGSTKSLASLLVRRYRGYPGLVELLSAFYASIRDPTVAVPVGRQSIIDTVRICQEIATRLHAEQREADTRAEAAQRAAAAELAPLTGRGIVLLTGGSGFLGRPTAKALRSAGWQVRVPVRRYVPAEQRLPGIEYITADLAKAVPDHLLEGVHAVLHLAAETSGSPADHDRNTVQATRNLLDAMLRNRVRRLINASSVAVLAPSRLGRPLHEDSPVDIDRPERGPYVRAKAEAERLTMRLAASGQIDLRTIRLGPLVDFDAFVAPGRLGREVARLFVAVGRPSATIGICSTATAAKTLVQAVTTFDSFERVVNLVEVPAPTRGALVKRLKASRPDLRILWLPFWLLWTASTFIRGVLKIVRPHSSPLNLYAAFKSEAYDPTVAQHVLQRSSVKTSTLS